VFYNKQAIADAVGTLTNWVGVSGLTELTVHVYGGNAGDTWRFWGSLDDEVDGTLGNATEVVLVDGSASAVVGSANSVVQLRDFVGMICVELDVDGGAPDAAGRFAVVAGNSPG
jgi:hypothetical protein